MFSYNSEIKTRKKKQAKPKNSSGVANRKSYGDDSDSDEVSDVKRNVNIHSSWRNY